MKIIILILFALCAFNVRGQKTADLLEPLDTLAASTTGTYTLGASIKEIGTVYFHVAGLKISGATGGTISYQYALDEAGTNYHTMATDTIVNGTTDASYEIAGFAGKKARVLVQPNGTTQSGSYRVAIVFKKEN